MGRDGYKETERNPATGRRLEIRDADYSIRGDVDVVGTLSKNGSPLGTVPVKATGAEVDTGTDDAKFVTPKALEDSDYIKEADLPPGGGVTNSAAANVLMKSDGTNAVASRFTDNGEGGTVNFGVDGELNIDGFAASIELTGIDDLGTHILSSQGDGAASKRFAIQGDGHLEWGPGTSGFDTGLLRSGVGQLALGGVSLAPSDENGGPFALGTVLTPFSTVFGDVIRLTPTAFASLPASPAEGMMAWVNDSNTATYGATVAAGGANKVLAIYDGTNWKVH